MRKKSIIIVILSIFIGSAQAQKGEKSIAAGPLISFPIGISNLKIGLGLEAIGQYNFSDRSALLLKTNLASWSYKPGLSTDDTRRLTFLTLQGGYRYQFENSGFFINGLVGVDIELADGFSSISFTLGGGKRFIVKNIYFIDTGLDLVGGDAENRINLKAVFSLLRWPQGR